MTRCPRPARAMLAGAALLMGAAGGVMAAATPTPGDPGTAALRLAVPVIAQAPERCGPAALAMVLRFYGAGDAAVAEADRAYSPALRGALITDLAQCASRVGFAARIATPGADSLPVFLAAGLPPLLHYRRGVGPLTRGHFGVLVGWDPARGEYLVNEGGERTARYRRGDLLRRWKAAGSLALIVTQREP